MNVPISTICKLLLCVGVTLAGPMWSKSDIQFALYRRDALEGVNFTLDSTREVATSTFDAFNKTVFICHGFSSSGYSPYLQSLKDAILQYQDINVFMIDWSGGAEGQYAAVKALVPDVGRALSEFIQILEDETQTSRSRMHLIGHSLGGHISGFAGSQLQAPKVGRISGIDVPDYGFDSKDTANILDPTDAEFVDEIQAAVSAIVKAHATFVVNGGMNQPACSGTMAKLLGLLKSAVVGMTEETSSLLACDHEVAILYYVESVTSRRAGCHFEAVACSSYKMYRRGRCTGSSDINFMGYHALKPSFGQVKYYLRTSAQSPFCQD